MSLNSVLVGLMLVGCATAPVRPKMPDCAGAQVSEGDKRYVVLDDAGLAECRPVMPAEVGDPFPQLTNRSPEVVDPPTPANETESAEKGW